IPAGETRIHRLTWMGWVLAGLTGILALLLQVSIAAETTLFGGVNLDVLIDYIGGTRYGTLWLIRMGLWWLMGGALFIAGARNHKTSFDGFVGAKHASPLYWVALLCGGGMLLMTSLFSHASAAQDELAAVAGDWLHLNATSFWLGGLIAFALVILPVRRQSEDVPNAVGRLVAGFSNYARTAVAALIVTGVYAAWLQVGSLEALLTTVYGRALLVKLILILPLLAIAGVNLVFTQRGLNKGQNVWVGRLRGLLGMEIALVIGVLLTVGVMTSGAPARGVMVVRDAVAPPAPEISTFQMQEGDTLMSHLEIIPGTVGENTFNVSLYDLDGNQITDASRIRLRFNSLDQNIGQSELRPELQPDGTYTISGANLSVPGNWRVRMTVARPGEFDNVIDFEPQVNLQLPPPAPVIDDTIPAFNRVIAALLAGMGLVGGGGFLIALNGLRWSGRGDWLAGGLVVVGAIFLITAAGSVDALERGVDEITVNGAWMYPGVITSEASVYMMLENDTDRDDRLIRATTEASADVTFHLTQVRDGIGRMRPIDDLELPARSMVMLAPGGYHLMLEHLERDFAVGDTFPITLTFASGDEITVNVMVSEGAP
ncbi:MAG: copper chaperone PCu(A)C, partial [Chitinophagaceae bacterium]|nr:copper chaperone PCu(A)C [Anaerolineae bacterium]